MWGHFCISHFQYFNPFYVVFRVCLHVPRVFQTRVYFLHACGFVYFSHVCVFTLNTRRTIAFCFVFRCVAESILFPSNTLMTGSSPLCIIFLTLLRKYELFGFTGLDIAGIARGITGLGLLCIPFEFAFLYLCVL